MSIFNPDFITGLKPNTSINLPYVKTNPLPVQQPKISIMDAIRRQPTLTPSMTTRAYNPQVMMSPSPAANPQSFQNAFTNYQNIMSRLAALRNLLASGRFNR